MLGWAGSASAQDGPGKQGATQPAENRLVIRPAPTARWGAGTKDVEKVLYSAAGQLWVHFPQRSLKPILVEPQGGPIVLYKRGPDGEFLVRLNTGSTYWSQYAFQFAHEFCHILCDYRQQERDNRWFEESLCETASLFALRRMAAAWKTAPPYPNWKGYASALQAYADQRLKDAALPAETTLAQWYQRHAEQLREDPCRWQNNRIVARVLLPLFEKQPQHWEAVAYLNSAKPHESRSFSAYLRDWHESCPEKHKAFVRQVALKFAVLLPQQRAAQRPDSNKSDAVILRRAHAGPATAPGCGATGEAPLPGRR